MVANVSTRKIQSSLLKFKLDLSLLKRRIFAPTIYACLQLKSALIKEHAEIYNDKLYVIPLSLFKDSKATVFGVTKGI